MSNHSLLNTALRLVATAALLVSVMTSPIRPSLAASRSGTSRSDYLRRNFGIPNKAGTNHRPNVPITSRVVQVKAVSTARGADLAADPVGHGISLICTSPHRTERDSARLPTDRASHPLRC